jgi:hypothetical protein
MTTSDPKADLQRYLQAARDALLWKLDGLSNYDVRRPMVPTGTNLLGLVKHVAGVELGYFGHVFDRPFDQELPGSLAGFGTLAWFEGAEPNADMFAAADESRQEIVGLYRNAWAHADETIGLLPLDSVGHVSWWPEDRREVTLHRVLVHVIAETHRHAGHADLVREMIDGSVGRQPGNDNMASDDAAWWENYRSRLERIARDAAER